MSSQKRDESQLPSALQQELEQSLYDRSQRIQASDEAIIDQQLERKLRSVLSTSAILSQKLRVLIQRVQLLYALLKDPTFTLKWSTKALIIAALLYFINPLDMMPDVLPLIGYIDDAFIIGLVLNALNEEIQRYAALHRIPLEVLS